MKKNVRLGRRPWDVALVFFAVFWSCHYSNAPFRVRSMAPKLRSLTPAEMDNWTKSWTLDNELKLCVAKIEEWDEEEMGDS